jgi:hypothetical protein
VAAVAEGAVHGERARLQRERLEDFGDHDRAVRAGGGLAGGQDLGDVAGVARRVELLVFLVEAPRVLPGIARAALAGSGIGRSGIRVGHQSTGKLTTNAHKGTRIQGKHGI